MMAGDAAAAAKLDDVPCASGSAAAAGILGDVLEGMRFHGTVFFRSELAAPWGVWTDDADFPRFHIALCGGFFVGLEGGGTPVRVEESGIILLPRGGVHWMADKPGRRLLSPAAVNDQCELGHPPFQNGTITNELMCARIHFDDQFSHPLLDALPEIVHIPGMDRDSSLWHLVALIDDEIRHSRSLSGPVVDRLTEVLFLQMLREFVAGVKTPRGYIAALHDHRLSRALQLIHQNPAKDWTLEAIAAKVCMSRATLARRFKEAVGTAPIEYLTQWRLLRAHDLVKYSNIPLEHIAEQVGFASAQTLARSFKRRFGYTPSALR
jgi:AraC-like DNA-binding protein